MLSPYRAGIARSSRIRSTSSKATTISLPSPMTRLPIGEENFAMRVGVRKCVMRAEIARNQLKALRRQIIAVLFMHLANHAFQKALGSFAASPEQADLSWSVM